MKKNIILSFLLLTLTTAAMAQGKLEIIIKNIKEPKGSIQVGLFNNEKDFLDKAIKGKVVKATDTEVTVVFDDLQPGEYAISIIHDENENKELDMNVMGIPKEGFAFGNNAMGTFGPPDFNETTVKIGTQLVRQEIKMKYM